MGNKDIVMCKRMFNAIRNETITIFDVFYIQGEEQIDFCPFCGKDLSELLKEED